MTQQTEKPTAAVEIWAMVNEEGEYVATHDEENLADLYGDCIGGTPQNLRTVKLTLTVPLPYTVQASATLPDAADGETPIALTIEG